MGMLSGMAGQIAGNNGSDGNKFRKTGGGILSGVISQILDRADGAAKMGDDYSSGKTGGGFISKVARSALAEKDKKSKAKRAAMDETLGDTADAGGGSYAGLGAGMAQRRKERQY